MRGIDIINRGYENFMDKLEALGAKVSLAETQGQVALV